jgi:flagellar biogenesis protein FliO
MIMSVGSVAVVWCALLGTPKGMTTSNGGDEGGFDFVLSGISRRYIDQAEVHALGEDRVVVFVPTAQLNPYEESFREGPIARIRVKPVRRGTVFVLLGHQKLNPEDVKIDPEGKIVVRETTFMGSGFEFVSESSRKKPNLLKTTTPNKAAPPTSPPKEKSNAASVDIQTALKTGTEQGDTQKVRPAKISGSFKKSAMPAFAQHTSSDKMLWIAGFLMLIGAFGFWAKQRRGLQGGGESIEVVAIQSFGGKHRLALIETCGDRLLLAASDKEVRVLSRFGNQDPELGLAQNSPFSEALDESDLQQAGVGSSINGDISGLLRMKKTTGTFSIPA